MDIPAFYSYQIAYKKGLTEQQTQFTSLPDPPDVEFAKKVTNQVSKVRSQRKLLWFCFFCVCVFFSHLGEKLMVNLKKKLKH